MDSNSERMSGSKDSVVDKEETLLSGCVQIQDCTQYKGKPYKDLTLEDSVDVEFETIEEVEKFYAYYSLAKGFSMRKDRLDRNRAGTLVLRRDLVCSKAGMREERSKKDTKHSSGNNSNKKRFRSTRRVSRENCPATLIARRCAERGVYYVAEFITEHNHPLARPEHRQFVRSHRHVRHNHLAQVNALRKVSVRTCRAYEYLVHQAGGYEFVGFTLKDLYNAMQGERTEILMDGDGESAITWMNLKALQDPDFYCIFSTDEENRLANMFWPDGQSLIDSTYKSNIYGKPLVVFVGCNNHRATVLFGCALLVDALQFQLQISCLFFWILGDNLLPELSNAVKISSLITFSLTLSTCPCIWNTTVLHSFCPNTSRLVSIIGDKLNCKFDANCRFYYFNNQDEFQLEKKNAD